MILLTEDLTTEQYITLLNDNFKEWSDLAGVTPETITDAMMTPSLVGVINGNFNRVVVREGMQKAAYKNALNAAFLNYVINPISTYWNTRTPSALIATVISNHRITLNWTRAVDFVDGYCIEQSLDGLNWSEIARAGTLDSEYACLGLNEETLFYYRVRAFISTAYSPYTPVVNAVTSESTLVTANFQSVQGATISQLTINYRFVESGPDVFINFGDGEGEHYLIADGGDRSITSNYTAPNTTYDVTISGSLLDVYSLGIYQANFTGNFNEFIKFTQLQRLTLIGCNLTGTTEGISSILWELILYGMLNVTIYFDSLSRNMYYLDIDTCDPLSPGSIQNLPPYLHYFRFTNNTAFGGNLRLFPTTIHHIIFATLRGPFTNDFQNLPPNLETAQFNVVCKEDFTSDITGDLDHLPATVIVCNFTAVGLNVTCNVTLLPYSAIWILLEHFGYNKITGDTSGRNPNMTGFGINYCPSTLFTFNVSDIPKNALNWIQLSNCGSASGNIEDLSPYLDDALNGGYDPNLTANCPLMFVSVGNGLIYNGGDLPVWRDVTMSLNLQWSSAMIDAFLINFASRTQASAKERLIWIYGTRTSASDAAVAALATMNKTVQMQAA